MKYEQIQILLNKINSQVNDLKNAEKISALHIDMVKKTIINLYETFLIEETEEVKEVSEIIENVATTTKEEKPETLSEVTVLEEEKKEEMIFIPVIEEEKFVENIPVEQIDVEEKNVTVAEKVEENVKKTPHSRTLEQFGLLDFDYEEDLPYQRQPKQEQTNDVNSSYSNVQAVTVVDTIVAKAKKPLQACITIGDKFSLIKDLFANNVAEYTDTIMALNEAESINTCLQIIAPIQEKYKWNDDSYAALTLLNLLKRRFA